MEGGRRGERRREERRSRSGKTILNLIEYLERQRGRCEGERAKIMEEADAKKSEDYEDTEWESGALREEPLIGRARERIQTEPVLP